MALLPMRRNNWLRASVLFSLRCRLTLVASGPRSFASASIKNIEVRRRMAANGSPLRRHFSVDAGVLILIGFGKDR